MYMSRYITVQQQVKSKTFYFIVWLSNIFYKRGGTKYDIQDCIRELILNGIALWFFGSIWMDIWVYGICDDQQNSQK